MVECAKLPDAFHAIQRRMEDPSLPPVVRENIEQHFQHLVSLADNLKQLGVSDYEINHHITEIYEKYEAALELKISRIREIEDSIIVTPADSSA